ncbi:ogr/Delta-like zinc finger family protein [Desulfocurvibacter africanus]|uniref:Transcriptional activator Ogr/delta n=1 Tax=Desulfocurvibacter africanus subsp. africanus str. Walvis Bay TaxID=690850 RepID=F3Z2S2_DESAF|nr:ogr/Delta-like zinc finger family protein [Desulfocurvibacter africanus]EGJ50239.1 transcriptional activator Ogr/delta [Desulfocurvibacter africanus subsp. africanus str. Walvis Bay]
MKKQVLVLVADAKAKAEAGVDYSPRLGALCPLCGNKMRIGNSPKWRDGVKERYHKCENTACLICAMGLSVKSVQVDNGVRQTQEVASV